MRMARLLPDGSYRPIISIPGRQYPLAEALPDEVIIVVPEKESPQIVVSGLPEGAYVQVVAPGTHNIW